MVPPEDQHHRLLRIPQRVGQYLQASVRVLQAGDIGVQKRQLVLLQGVGPQAGSAILPEFRGGIGLVVLHGDGEDHLGRIVLLPEETQEHLAEGDVGDIAAPLFRVFGEGVVEQHPAEAEGVVDHRPVVQAAVVAVEEGHLIALGGEDVGDAGQEGIALARQGSEGVAGAQQAAAQARQHLHLHVAGAAAVGVGEEFPRRMLCGQGVVGRQGVALKFHPRQKGHVEETLGHEEDHRGDDGFRFRGGLRRGFRGGLRGVYGLRRGFGGGRRGGGQGQLFPDVRQGLRVHPFAALFFPGGDLGGVQAQHRPGPRRLLRHGEARPEGGGEEDASAEGDEAQFAPKVQVLPQEKEGRQHDRPEGQGADHGPVQLQLGQGKAHDLPRAGKQAEIRRLQGQTVEPELVVIHQGQQEEGDALRQPHGPGPVEAGPEDKRRGQEQQVFRPPAGGGGQGEEALQAQIAAQEEQQGGEEQQGEGRGEALVRVRLFSFHAPAPFLPLSKSELWPRFSGNMSEHNASKMRAGIVRICPKNTT